MLLVGTFAFVLPATEKPATANKSVTFAATSSVTTIPGVRGYRDQQTEEIVDPVLVDKKLPEAKVVPTKGSDKATVVPTKGWDEATGGSIESPQDSATGLAKPIIRLPQPSTLLPKISTEAETFDRDALDKAKNRLKTNANKNAAKLLREITSQLKGTTILPDDLKHGLEGAGGESVGLMDKPEQKDARVALTMLMYKYESVLSDKVKSDYDQLLQQGDKRRNLRTWIENKNTTEIANFLALENSQTELLENSQTELLENSQTELLENSQTELTGNVDKYFKDKLGTAVQLTSKETDALTELKGAITDKIKDTKTPAELNQVKEQLFDATDALLGDSSSLTTTLTAKQKQSWLDGFRDKFTRKSITTPKIKKALVDLEGSSSTAVTTTNTTGTLALVVPTNPDAPVKSSADPADPTDTTGIKLTETDGAASPAVTPTTDGADVPAAETQSTTERVPAAAREVDPNSVSDITTPDASSTGGGGK